MPLFDFECEDCGYRFEHRVRVGVDVITCDACGGDAERQFTPTVHIVIPAHFRLPAGWALPDNNDTAGWEARQGNSTSHAPKQKAFKQEFDETFKGDL